MTPTMLLLVLNPTLVRGFFPAIANNAASRLISAKQCAWSLSPIYLLDTAKHHRTIHRLSHQDDDGAEPSITSTTILDDMSFQQWTIEHDQLLWKYQSVESIPQLAARLGRGLRGTEERLQRLQTVGTSAYQRLFGDGGNERRNDGEEPKVTRTLVPASQILRRIEWDPALEASEFFIRYYDRVQDTLVDCPLMAPNTSIDGSARKLIDALPEHRIVAILYRDYVVWDRESKLDLVSSGDHMGAIQQGYDAWKAEEDAKKAQQAARKKAVLERLQGSLGDEDYNLFLDLTKELTDSIASVSTSTKKKKAQVSPKVRVETFVEQSLGIFRKVAYPELGDALEALSQASALHPEAVVRQLVLDELHLQLSAITTSRKKGNNPTKVNTATNLPDLNEDDLVETFVRGTGPGGQKINKTSNRVVLVHTPTQVRVECQDTRSLPQNRKIARKRLRIKLDAYYNGNESRTQQVAKVAASKKQKAKARSRARLRKKQMEKEERQQMRGGASDE